MSYKPPKIYASIPEAQPVAVEALAKAIRAVGGSDFPIINAVMWTPPHTHEGQPVEGHFSMAGVYPRDRNGISAKLQAQVRVNVQEDGRVTFKRRVRVFGESKSDTLTAPLYQVRGFNNLGVSA